MGIEGIISEHGTLVSVILAAIILFAAIVCGILIWKWNKDDKLMDHRGVIEMMPSLISTLGVFFTFAGIALGLYYFNDKDLTTSIPQLLTGLKTAFFTSLAGMTGSMLLSGQVNKLFDKKSGGISDSEEAARLVVNKLDTLSDQNVIIRDILKAWNNSIDEIKSMALDIHQMNERQLNIFNNSSFILNKNEEQVAKMDDLVTLARQNVELSKNNPKSFDTLLFDLATLISLERKVDETLQSVEKNHINSVEKQTAIDSKLESMLISIGNMEESDKEILKETKAQNGRVGEMMDHTEALVSGQDEISKHVAKFGETLHGEIVEIEDKMTETNKLLNEKFEEFAELLRKSNTEALVEVMKKVTEEFQKQMKDLIGRLVKENFDQLNKSVERLNKWQEDNKEMIQSLTSQYKQMAENFENTSVSLTKVDEDTRYLVSEGGKLHQIVNLLNQVIVEDEKFLKISSDLQNTANLTKTNFEQFDEATKKLNDWVKKQRNFVDGVMVLIQKLDDLNKIRDYNEQFWKQTRDSMNEGVSIIRNGTESLNQQVSGLNRQFYARLSTTLTELDNCIQALITKADNSPF